MRPSRNPDVPIEGRVWYGGAWRTAEGIEVARAYARSRRKRVPEIVHEEARRWREGNREYLSERDRQYRERNTEARREWERKRRARLLAATVEEIPAAIVALYGVSPCFYCAGPGGTLDHFHPLAKGGEHSLRNLIPACKSCNSAKRDRPASEFLARAA